MKCRRAISLTKADNARWPHFTARYRRSDVFHLSIPGPLLADSFSVTASPSRSKPRCGDVRCSGVIFPRMPKFPRLASKQYLFPLDHIACCAGPVDMFALRACARRATTALYDIGLQLPRKNISPTAAHAESLRQSHRELNGAQRCAHTANFSYQ